MLDDLTRTAVLRAGHSGVRTALRLVGRGERVTVIEREVLPGGLAAGFEPALASGSRSSPFRTPVPNLWLGSMSQVYPQGRGQNYSIDLGERFARYIIAAG